MEEFQFLQRVVGGAAQDGIVRIDVLLQRALRLLSADLTERPQRHPLNVEVNVIGQLDQCGDGFGQGQLPASARRLIAHLRQGAEQFLAGDFGPALVGAASHRQDGADTHLLCGMCVGGFDHCWCAVQVGVSQRLKRVAAHIQVLAEVVVRFQQRRADGFERVWQYFVQLPHQHEVRQRARGGGAYQCRGIVFENLAQLRDQADVFIFVQSGNRCGAHLGIFIAHRNAQRGGEIHLEVLYGEGIPGADSPAAHVNGQSSPNGGEALNVLCQQAGKLLQVGGLRRMLQSLQTLPQTITDFSVGHTSSFSVFSFAQMDDLATRPSFNQG